MPNVFVKKAISFIHKYKVLHVLFWIWTCLDLFHLRLVDSKNLIHTAADVAIIKFCQACCVYFVVYFLMPRFLNKARYAQFTAGVIITVITCSIVTLGLQDIYDLLAKGRHMHSFLVTALFASQAVDSFIITIFFFAAYSIQGRINTEQRNRQLEKERLETELNFLKAQINPHFLFNAINSIYVLIDEDKKLASKTLLKFSALLRYQLYDCSQDHMPLAREMEFLQDYIDLETLRCGDNLSVSFQNRTDISGREIAPFILIPFVENAFKHRSYNIDGNSVLICAEVRNDIFKFSVANTYEEEVHPGGGKPGSGIGLQNVSRRLELLYKGKHELTAVRADGVYSVTLEMKLNENAMPVG